MDATKATGQQLSAAELQELKPRRRSFTRTLVLANNGAVVEEKDWRAKVGNAEGRELNKILKKEGMTPVKIFLKEEYEAAKVAFYQLKHGNVKEHHSSTIDAAFEQAGQPKVKRIESALRSIFPLFRSYPQQKTIHAFKNIIKSFASAGIIDDLQQREQRREARASAAVGPRKPRTRRQPNQPAQGNKDKAAANQEQANAAA